MTACDGRVTRLARLAEVSRGRECSIPRVRDRSDRPSLPFIGEARGPASLGHTLVGHPADDENVAALMEQAAHAGGAMR